MSKTPINNDDRILDARKGETEKERVSIRIRINSMVKASNGDTSKYIPAKYGYGSNGPKKY